MKKLTTILLLVLVATSAFADVLWDQPYESEEAGGFFNSESGSPPFGSTNYSMADVTVGVDNEWLIDSITTVRVVARPTPSVPPRVRRPWKQPTIP